jgi:hypothetical protein
MRRLHLKTSLQGVAILAALSSPAFAQAAGAQIKVDGVIDPAEWQGAQHITDFKMVQPFTQAVATQPTEAWIKATPEGLAIAFRNTKVAGVETPRQRSRRDQEVNIDRVNLMVDFDGDSHGGYSFMLTASDGIQDATITGGGNFSSDWDGNWQHAVVDGDGEWTAEMLIPWYTATMQKVRGDKRTIAVYLDRVIGSVNQRMAWPAISFERPQFLNQFQKIEIPAYSQSLLAITPYVVGVQDLVKKNNAFNAGVDVFWKPSGQFQLTATINPDFGQVESDSLVVNFGAQETFFSDKRPFFTENQGLFDFGLLLDNSKLLYTRRIGAGADDRSGPADILGAIKFNGSIGGTQYGAFLADERGDAGRRFGAFRLQRSFGTQTLGAMLTSVDRPFLDRSANVLGFDHRWQPDPSLTVASTLVGSDIDVAGQHTRDFGFTTLVQKTLDKEWSVTGLLIHYGKDFEVNDAGYLGRNNLNYGQFKVDRRITGLPEESAYASHNWQWRIDGSQNTDGRWLQRQFQMSRHSQRRDGGDFHWNLQASSAAFDDRITRGNGLMRTEPGFGGHIHRILPRRGNWKVGAELSAAVAGGVRGDTPRMWNTIVSATYYFNDALNLEFRAGHTSDQEFLVWQHDNLVSGFQMSRNDFNASLNWNIGTRQELRVKLEALGLNADNPKPWRIAADGRALASNDLVQPFSLRNLGFQVRYRYELAPLSDLYIVYGRGGFMYDGYAAGAFGQFGDAFSLRDDEQLLVKLSYRFEL